MTEVEIDIESRSACDLTKTGVYVYAEHPTTQITHVGYAPRGGIARMWLPLMPAGWSAMGTTVDGRPVEMFGGPMPGDLFDLVCDPETVWIAHNASFERIMLSGPAGRAIGFPGSLRDVPRWVCTAAMAARLGLPRTLEGACRARGVAVQKDAEGHKLMLRMCKPDPKTGAWWGGEAEMIREGSYCAQDVYAESALLDACPRLSDFERAVWELTERMNDRGVAVDLPLLETVSILIADASRTINARLHEITGGLVQKVTNHDAITRWLQSVDADDTGLGDDGVGKAALAAMLERTDLPGIVRDVLLIRRDGGKSSASKYAAIASRVSADGRIRGVLVYCGAASTGRFSSRGAQLHNLPRPNLLKKSSTALALIRDIQAGASLAMIEDFYGPPLVLASELLRPVFRAGDGRVLVRGDSSQIEARTLPWLAGADWKLDAFRAYDAGTGPDIYRVGAAAIYRVLIEAVDEQIRQVGKVSELSLGFAGGWKALQAMCRGYGAKIPHAEKPTGPDAYDWEPPAGSDEWIVRQWRNGNPEVADRELGLWALAQKAAMDCMESPPGETFRVGQQGMYFRRGRDALAMYLPSGTALRYWAPQVVTKMMPWGKPGTVIRFKSEDSQSKQWYNYDAYGGLFVQNATQATARDLMAWWLLEMARAGIDPLLTVHDEGIGESDLSEAEAASVIRGVMGRTPAWAGGLPVSSDATANLRYLKG